VAADQPFEPFDTQRWTPAVKRVVELATEAAEGSQYIGTEHLLLGLLRCPNVAESLARIVDADAARQQEE
jgi:Clp amino terminal domain, pathogenicity island component